MSGMGHWTRVLGASLLLTACPAPVEQDDDQDTLDTITTVTATTTTGQGGTEGDDDNQDGTQGTTSGTTGTSTGLDGTDDNDDNDTVGPPKLDLGPLPDFGEVDMGCRKVDFLFVIDNSGSMSAQQTQLLNSFQGFIDAIQMSLEGSVDSYHVGVVTSDAYFQNQPGCNAIGDLVSQTNGGVCNFAEGNRFATEADDLATVFPCMATVGTSGSGLEMPVTAAVAAVDPTNNAPGACNAGFLRDDAILVLVILTDDPPHDGSADDAHPMANTANWVPDIIAAKNGDPEALVVIGFIPVMDVSCVVFNIESPNLINFVMAFGDQGAMTSICEPDFGPAFADAVSTIVDTCENFEPPA